MLTSTQIGETPLKTTPILIAVFAFAIGIVTANYLLNTKAVPPETQAGTRVPVVAGQFGGDFTLTQPNKTVKLSDFQDKVVVMYFGYASCPDICPTSLAIISAGLKTLSATELAQVQPIFVSIDPERDKGDNLINYVKHFHPNLIGITGTPNEVQQAARQYGAFYAKVPSTSAMGYTVDHTSNTYLISKAGKFVTILPHDSTPNSIAAAIRQEL